MVATSFIIGFFGVVAAAVHAADYTEPTYDECFKLAEKAIQADAVGLHMEADTLAAKGLATPATLPANASDSVTIKPPSRTPPAGQPLPGLDGSGDFEASLRQQGVRIVVDPTNPDAAPTVELDNVRFNGQTATFTAPVKEPTEEPENTEEGEEERAENAELTAAEIYELNRTHCRIMYGMSF